jgi:hypothetical protein
MSQAWFAWSIHVSFPRSYSYHVSSFIHSLSILSFDVFFFNHYSFMISAFIWEGNGFENTEVNDCVQCELCELKKKSRPLTGSKIEWKQNMPYHVDVKELAMGHHNETEFTNIFDGGSMLCKMDCHIVHADIWYDVDEILLSPELSRSAQWKYVRIENM